MTIPALEVVARRVRRLLAPNPGPMTLNGTNTWLLGDPAAGPVVVVDPGPDDDGHRQAILAAAGAGVAVVVLTHRHADHSAGAAALAVAAGCSVRAVDPALRIPAGAALADGDALVLPGGTLRVLATPGHTADSCCLLLTGDDGVARLLTGDTVLGRGTTVIAEPDGHLGDYLDSLRRLQAVVAREAVVELLPGHGPRVPDPVDRLAAYLRHRLERLEQVRAALAAGAVSAAEVVDRVYGDIDVSLRAAAEQSVRAQLDHVRTSDAPE